MMLLAALVAVQAGSIPPASGPYPADMRRFTLALSPDQVDVLWAASLRFCAAPGRRDGPDACRVMQMSAITDISNHVEALRQPHHDRAEVTTELSLCAYNYADNGSGDARILAACLGYGQYLIYYGDVIAQEDGANRRSWPHGNERLTLVR